MPKKEKKGVRRKAKVGKRKKEKPVKKEITEIKEIRNSEAGLEKDSEDDFIETQSFRNFSMASQRISPVLEKVAVAGKIELEEQLANVPISRENEEQKIINYGGKQENYGTTHEARKKDTFKYSEKTSYGNEKEKTDDKNRLTRQKISGEWKIDDREERWQMEGMNSVEESLEKKYLEKGEY